MPNNHKPLNGLKVIDLTTALSGPFCTMFFGDYGAEVIKIETPDGEQCRTWGPIDEKTGESGFFANYNRNKKGVTLNLKTEKGLNMLYELVKDADFLCENFKGGVTQKLKVDYETIQKINPRIIYVSGSGFGQTSPIGHRPCYDIVAQSMGGMVNLTGFKETDPVKVGPSVADHVSGIYQFVGAMVALYEREKTGVGQMVDVSMVDTIFSLFEDTGLGGQWHEALLAGFVTILAGALLVLFLGTRLGLSIRATGDNIDMVRASSINPTFTITVGLCISNALTALSGAMVGQYQNTADINGGTGIVVIGLACLIIGETIVGRGAMFRGAVAVIVGSILYRFIYAIVLYTKVVPIDCLKLVTAIVVGLAIAAPTLKSWAAFQARKR